MPIVLKYLLTAGIIVAVSEVAKRSDKLGALIASLPLVTILVMIWLHVEKQGDDKIGTHAFLTFWYVIPTLPMFPAIPWMLNRGYSFWATLLAYIVVTGALVFLTAVILRRFGVELL